MEGVRSKVNAWFDGMPISAGIHKEMILTKNLLFFLLTLFMGSSACVADTLTKSQNLNLITARPVAAKFIKDNDDKDALIAPATYSVSLSDVSVIQGEPGSFPNEITVDLQANQIDALVRYDKVYLLVDTSLNSFRVIYWERVISMACLPEELVDERFKQFYFDDKWGQKGVKRTFLRGRVNPDKD